MNKHLDEYLCKKYPLIFADRNKSMRETCMCWGFSHNDGWFFLIEALCANIQWRIDNPPHVYKKTLKVRALRAWNWLAHTVRLPYNWQIYGDMMEPMIIPQVVADQVKEKFGSLRFYYHGGDDAIDGMVQLAESLSHRICEDCGVMDELVNKNSRGWIQTTCPCCAKDKETHFANRRTELVEVFTKKFNDEIEQELKAFNESAKTPLLPQTKQNDRSPEAIQ